MSFVHCSMTPLECDAQWRFIAHALTYFVTVKKIMTHHVDYQCSLQGVHSDPINMAMILRWALFYLHFLPHETRYYIQAELSM